MSASPLQGFSQVRSTPLSCSSSSPGALTCYLVFLCSVQHHKARGLYPTPSEVGSWPVGKDQREPGGVLITMLEVFFEGMSLQDLGGGVEIQSLVIPEAPLSTIVEDTCFHLPSVQCWGSCQLHSSC